MLPASLLAAWAVAAPQACQPEPPPAEFPIPAAKACAEGKGPAADKLAPPGADPCGRLHARLLEGATTQWEAELAPRTGKLLGPLEKRPLEERVASLWNQDAAGKAACVKTPHLELCDRELREAWLAEQLEEDSKLIARTRELLTWYVQAHALCAELRMGWTAGGAKQLEAHRKRLHAAYQRLFPPKEEAEEEEDDSEEAKAPESADAARLRLLGRHFPAPAIDLERLRAWGPAVDAWAKALAKKPAEPKRPLAPKRKKLAPAETAPPAD